MSKISSNPLVKLNSSYHQLEKRPECERQWSQSRVRGVKRRAYEADGRVAYQIRE
jgi:hypothetical protein